MTQNYKGKITVIGLGPGDSALLAPMAREALVRADAIAGYTTYLDLIDPDILASREIISSGMMKEIQRVTEAVEAAADGKNVCLVSSGDAGIYGMSGLALEIIEEKKLTDIVEAEIIPGIPALCAAAALLGAPLVHDFAVISLSDLLTPWELIEKRAKAAAEADFTTVLYNPKSKRRDWQLPKILEIVAQVRDPETPVGLVRKAYRDGQSVSVHTLRDFPVEKVDMLSLLVIGNTSTRIISGKMVTPRGYFEKYGTSVT